MDGRRYRRPNSPVISNDQDYGSSMARMDSSPRPAFSPKFLPLLPIPARSPSPSRIPQYRGSGNAGSHMKPLSLVPERPDESDPSATPTPPPELNDDHSVAVWGLQIAGRIRQLRNAARGLIPKLYRLSRLVDLGPQDSPKPQDQVWKSGIVPEFPKLCTHLWRKFPEHPRNLQLDKVDRTALEVFASFGSHFQASLQPWYEVLVDLALFREHALVLLNDLATSIVTLSPMVNPLVLRSFMGLFSDFVRVNILSLRAGKKMIVQVHALTVHYTTNGQVPESYDRYGNPKVWQSQGVAIPRYGDPKVWQSQGVAIPRCGNPKVWQSQGMAILRACTTTLPPHFLHLTSPRVLQYVQAYDSPMLGLQEVLMAAAVCVAVMHTSPPMLGVQEDLRYVQAYDSPMLGVQEDLRTYVQAYDSPMLGLQEDLRTVAPRISKAVDVIAPIILAWEDTQKLRTDVFVKPFTSWPDVASAPPPWDLMVWWVTLLHTRAIVPLFRDEVLCVHAEVQQWAVGRLGEGKKAAKAAARHRAQGAQEEYQRLRECCRLLGDLVSGNGMHACLQRMADAHRRRRFLLGHEGRRLLLRLADEPSLLPPMLQLVLAVLALLRAEVHWAILHTSCLAQSAPVTVIQGFSFSLRCPLEGPKVRLSRSLFAAEVGGPEADSVAVLIDTMFRLVSLIQTHMLAVQAHASWQVQWGARRVKELIALPAVRQLAMGAQLEAFFRDTSASMLAAARFLCDADVACAGGGNGSGGGSSMEYEERMQMHALASDQLAWHSMRSEWIQLQLLLSSPYTTVSARVLHLVSGGDDGPTSIVTECNRLYTWCRCIDQLPEVVDEQASLHLMCYYRPQMTQVFRQVLFSPHGTPSHAIGWLMVAQAFLHNLPHSLPDERPTLLPTAVQFADSLLHAIMGGVDSLLSALQSDQGLTGLHMKTLPAAAAILLATTTQGTSAHQQSLTHPSADQQHQLLLQLLPGSESQPHNCAHIAR
ncbi:unnamed protein product [Closterium sp. Yama58-4]|nr:unnamed protein product [Closterium sp. Yama58-4]